MLKPDIVFTIDDFVSTVISIGFKRNVFGEMNIKGDWIVFG